MKDEKDAEAEFMGMGGRAWTYEERDVPANQLFHNLESRIKELLNGWQSKDFDEKIRLSTGIAGYLRLMEKLLAQHGIELYDVKKLGGLNKIERIHTREVLDTMIADSRGLVERLQFGMEHAKDLFHAYKDLIMYDPRVSEVTRNELMASVRPIALKEAMQQVQKNGGIESPHAPNYVIGESEKLGEPVGQLVAQKQYGHAGTALVPVDRKLIEIYVMNYYKLEVFFKFLRWRHKKETGELARLEQQLDAHGGPLTPSEQQKLNQFENGRDPDRSIEIYTAYLDYLRFVGETTFRHGWPDKDKRK